MLQSNGRKLTQGEKPFDLNLKPAVLSILQMHFCPVRPSPALALPSVSAAPSNHKPKRRNPQPTTRSGDLSHAIPHPPILLPITFERAEANDTVCYEGCLVPPVDDPTAAPLPNLLLASGSGPVQLIDCYDAAVAGGYQYFAIVDTDKCYGGNSDVVGWALNDEECPLNCTPDGEDPYSCGGFGLASVFSMGFCRKFNILFLSISTEVSCVSLTTPVVAQVRIQEGNSRVAGPPCNTIRMVKR